MSNCPGKGLRQASPCGRPVRLVRRIYSGKTEANSIKMKTYSDKQRVNSGMWDGDRDVDIRCQTTKVVTTRKPQTCTAHNNFQGAEELPAGTRMVYERAVVDGEWASNYACVACVDAWLTEIGEKPAGETKAHKMGLNSIKSRGENQDDE
jgi:hypothetical protein